MNAAVLLMTSAFAAGGEPHATPPHAPAVISTGAACDYCGAPAAQFHHGGACCDVPCCEEERPGLLARIRAWCKRDKRDDCCEVAPVCECAPAPVCECPPAPACGPVCCEEERPGLLDRIRALCRRDKRDECCEPAPVCCPTDGYPHGAIIHPTHPGHPGHLHPAPGSEIPPAEPKKMPEPKDGGEGKVGGLPVYPQATPVAVPRHALPLGGSANPFELPRQGETTDHSSLTGALQYVHTDGGYWIVRYAGPGQEDPYGGRVALAAGSDMGSFQEGDVVAVRGTILRERTSRYLTAPLYRVDTIHLVERP